MKNDSNTPKKSFQDSLDDMGEHIKKLVKGFSVYAGFSYLVLLLVGITVTVFLVTQSLQQDTGSGSSEGAPDANYSLVFDQNTIQRIKALATQQQTTSPNPSRPNPFTE